VATAINCGIQVLDQARARPSGEKCGLMLMETGSMADSQKSSLLATTVLTAAQIKSVAVAAAPTTTILDDYIGSDSHGDGYATGNTGGFQGSSMDISLSDNMLSVDIHTNFAD